MNFIYKIYNILYYRYVHYTCIEKRLASRSYKLSQYPDFSSVVNKTWRSRYSRQMLLRRHWHEMLLRDGIFLSPHLPSSFAFLLAAFGKWMTYHAYDRLFMRLINESSCTFARAPRATSLQFNDNYARFPLTLTTRGPPQGRLRRLSSRSFPLPRRAASLYARVLLSFYAHRIILRETTSQLCVFASKNLRIYLFN